MTDEKLMLYIDGELSPAESREVERELSATPDLVQKRDALLQMRDILRARYELAEEDAAPQLTAMWERVRSGLPAAQVATVPQRPGLWDRVRDWLEAYRSHLVTGTLAATAGALIATVVTSKIVAPGLLANASGPEAAEVESLEVIGGSGMVFQPDSKDESTIIWITADNEPDEGVDEEAPGGPI
jgi:anti-sigma factor RsiW